MPESTLRLPTRPVSTRGSRRPRRRGPIAAVLVVAAVAAIGAGGWAWWHGSVGSVPIREHCTATASGSTYELDPEQAGNAAIITEVAVSRGLPARAASIGIATALQESKLRNLNYGDRDSLGLFQQRPSQGWGTTKQILDPVYATNAFYDVLAKVDGYESMPITKVAQKVQRSAYPSAYADHEPAARVVASTLSGYSPGGFSCVLKAGAAATPQSPAADGLTARAKALATAAGRETGRKNVQADGAAGTTLRFTVPASTGARNAWALAGWAVARAGSLDVVEVDVAGKVWSRARSTVGWRTATSAPAPSDVLIKVS